MNKMKVYLGADHRGFELKNLLRSWLERRSVLHEDLGAYEHNPQDDYTLFAERVASVVAQEKHSRGVLICGSGVGVDVMANKFDGIRASIGKSTPQVKAGRKDDDMNILVIAADFTSEKQAKQMLSIFLDTEFDGLSRHKRRLEEIKRVEQNN